MSEDRVMEEVAPTSAKALPARRELDALSAIMPEGLRERVAEFLSAGDIATLTHLAKEGMGRNTIRALASDLNYLETWSLAATGSPLPWPAPEALALKFVAHHLYDAAERERDPAHGMPDDVAALLRDRKCLRSAGPHAPTPRALVHPAPLAWRRGALRLREPPQRPASRRPGGRSAPRAQEPESRNAGRLGQAPRHLHGQPPRRRA
jgi:hypothetical protein